ncbi:hypothetical protein [Mycolicibacterium sp.]|uniref:hypothetical protein n=1 Tax=Mycolicibacterium sp. TaxID=2320850 RepID=UPI003D0D7A32
MLATFGLDRVEASLRRDTISATDVAEFLEQAEASDVDTLARNGMDSALDKLHRRLSARESATPDVVEHIPGPRLPTREYTYERANREFQQTRHANSV